MSGQDKKEKRADAGERKARIYRRYVSSCPTSMGAEAVSPDRRRAMFAYFHSKLTGWLPQDRSSSILDLGCGRGNLLAFLRGLGYQDLSGVDLSPEQVRLAREGLPEVEIHEQDLFDFLRGREGVYDCVFAFDLIEHLDKDHVLKFLDLVRAALKPGGRFILQTPNAASPWGIDVRYSDFTHECCFTPTSLRQVLTLAGFKDVEFQEAGPAPLGVKSMVRYILWKFLSLAHHMYNMVEMGAPGGGVYTRVLQCRAVRGAD